MKKNIKILLITLLCVFTSLKAQSAVLTGTQVKQLIVNQVDKNYKQYTDAQLEIEVVALPFKDLYLPDGKITFEVKPTVDKFMARDLEKVNVFVDGHLQKTFNVPVVVRAYKDVLVASCFIEREQQLRPDVVKVKRVEVSTTFEYPLEPAALNKEILAKKSFREGEIIDKRYVKYRPDVSRNSIVTVIFESKNLSISIDGTALSSGVKGDSVCIINKNYNKVYTGRIIGENKVLVKI